MNKEAKILEMLQNGDDTTRVCAIAICSMLAKPEGCPRPESIQRFQCWKAITRIDETRKQKLPAEKREFMAKLCAYILKYWTKK